MKLYKGDCVDILKTLPDKSIDLVLTDPPYDYINGGAGKGALSARMTKLKGDIDFMSSGFDYDTVLGELMRVCKVPNILLFCSNKQLPILLSYFKDKDVSQTVLVWCKTNPAPCMNGNHLSDIEYCVYVRGKGATFNMDTPFDYKHKWYMSGLVDTNRFHPAQKPDELLKRYISLHSKPGDVVLDCFMGSGSTGVWAKKLERDFIGIEITDKYFDIAQKRIDGAKIERKLF